MATKEENMKQYEADKRKFRRLLDDLLVSADAYAFRGSQPKEDIPLIESEYELANLKLEQFVISHIQAGLFKSL